MEFKSGMKALTFFAAVSFSIVAASARAEVTETTVADQFGVAYLPLMVMKDKNLLEKHATAAGLKDLKVKWAKFGGGSTMNDALLSGSIGFAVAGLPSLVLLWEKTKSSPLGVKGLAAINNTPMYLNTRNPKIKSIRDFTSADKIAMPSVKVSIQAITLEMAAAKAFGTENFAKLDSLTVSMKHPDAMAALLSGSGEVDTHFASPPFQFQELEKPGIHRVLSSTEVLGDSSFIVAFTTSKFEKENPKTVKAFMAALEEAMEFINKNKPEAAALYVKMTSGKESDTPAIQKMLNDPDLVFSTTPKGMEKYSDFMFKVGTIKSKPSSWKEMFFPYVHDKPGN